MTARDDLVTLAFRHSCTAAVIAALFAGSVQAADAQVTHAGSIVGVVRDSAGGKLSRAVLTLLDSSLHLPRVESDDSGAFVLPGIPAGPHRLMARRIGNLPETLTVVVSAATPARVEFRLKHTVVLLATERVESDPFMGKMAPFNTRRSRGVGAFITREQIDARKPSSMSELLRYVPGVGVTQKMAGQNQPVHMERSARSTVTSACEVQLYVDGHPYPNGSVDDFKPAAIEGVEIYRSASEVPADFRTRDATCGVIALWTRDPDAAARRAP